MNITLLFCLLAAACAAPQLSRPDERRVNILRYDREDDVNGNFNFVFEADNGVRENRIGSIGSGGQVNMRGVYIFPLPDGSLAPVHYIADENGFRVDSPLIPTPHPLPAHAAEQIRVAEEQRRLGIQF